MHGAGGARVQPRHGGGRAVGAAGGDPGAPRGGRLRHALRLELGAGGRGRRSPARDVAAPRGAVPERGVPRGGAPRGRAGAGGGERVGPGGRGAG